jgi:hypothetical protein
MDLRLGHIPKSRRTATCNLEQILKFEKAQEKIRRRFNADFKSAKDCS